MIELENVTRLYGNFCAVDDICLSIKTGEIVGLLGPNGAGKTTTMRMITGFLEPSSGKIKIDGLDVTENQVECKSKIGYMPESAPMYNDMIVADYLGYIAKIEGQDPAVKVPLLAKTCGLKEVMHKNIGELSRGNKQRVGLAHALMNDPEILILDEPTSGLDPNQVSEVRSLIKEIGKTRTVIISTHILSEVEMLCNRVIIISDGKKVADSSVELLREQYGSSSVVKVALGNFSSSDDVTKKLTVIPEVSSVKADLEIQPAEFYISMKNENEKDVRPLIAKTVVENGWDLFSMEFKKNSLEEVFHSLTQGGNDEQ